jgi:hypothetical protein
MISAPSVGCPPRKLKLSWVKPEMPRKDFDQSPSR